ncbi:MAG: hypothetical protein V2A62_01500 [Candidatus Woesearchaeota archaeon]
MLNHLHESGKRCLYCRKELDLSQWNSQWDNLHQQEHHYKAVKCECGKKNWIKVDFLGSGHDEILQRKLSPLESMVRKVREK